MASALNELMADASEIYIMGHSFADMDAVGAEAGLYCIARKHGKRAQMVIDLEHNAAGAVLAKLQALPEYAGAFTSGAEAFLKMRPGALVIVVDTNRPDMVESPQLLESSNRVAVIDHHRRAASYIENAAFSFHEPYASSASELVTELLQYLVEPADLLREEAEALLAGSVLDTKHFTLRTGGRTFEAAAFLRRAGADTTDVQRLFQSDLSEMVSRYDIIRRAELYREDIAVAAIAEDLPGRKTSRGMWFAGIVFCVLLSGGCAQIKGQIIAMLCTTSWSIVGSTVLVAYVALVRFGKRSSLAAWCSCTAGYVSCMLWYLMTHPQFAILPMPWPSLSALPPFFVGFAFSLAGGGLGWALDGEGRRNSSFWPAGMKPGM